MTGNFTEYEQGKFAIDVTVKGALPAGTNIIGTITTKEYPKAYRIDEVSTDLIYIGSAEPGTLNAEAKWAIKKMIKAGTVTSIQWADGNASEDNIWDNRAILSYS